MLSPRAPPFGGGLFCSGAHVGAFLFLPLCSAFAEKSGIKNNVDPSSYSQPKKIKPYYLFICN